MKPEKRITMGQPQPIGELLPKNRSQMSSQGLQPALPQGGRAPDSPAVQRVRATYHSDVNFLTLFNPGNQVAYTKDLVRVFTGKAPTLNILTKAFGPNTRDNWLDVQITELAVFSGCRDKLTARQTESLISVVAEEYSFLKVTELMFFFRRFKAGVYGKFYGAVDPLTITCALREFCDERREFLRQLARKRKEKERINDPEHIRYLRSYAENERMSRFYSLNFRSKDFTIEDFREIWWLFKMGYERSDHGYND